MVDTKIAGTITELVTHDIRFPTSRDAHGSDAMNRDPDYSAAYVILETDRGDGITGHGLTFTIGRGTEIVAAAVNALKPLVIGRAIAEFTDAPGAFWKLLTGDSQLRWLGPEKGVIHMATAAVVNALWDLWAKIVGKPLWKLLSDLSPAQIVELVDWRYLTDVLTPEAATRALDALVPTRSARERAIRASGYPAYTTSVGWLGYSDETLRLRCRDAIASGFDAFKMKVGHDVDDDERRAAIIRQEIGPDRALMFDANQRWDVHQAIEWTRRLARYGPRWIEEPTSPDDVLGHAAIARAVEPWGIGVATGEHCPNRVVFKQLMQARAMAFCQLDFCRLGGVNEVVAVQLLAAHFNIPVCPHAGGVGLCEYAPHASVFDYVAVTGSLGNRTVEYVDHLHEHFVHPCVIRDGRYLVPLSPGTNITIKHASLTAHAYPEGSVWRSIRP